LLRKNEIDGDSCCGKAIIPRPAVALFREKENEQIDGGAKALARGGAPAGESTAGGTVVEETKCGGGAPQRRADPCGALEKPNPAAVQDEEALHMAAWLRDEDAAGQP
jgi:hypothetical protein